MLLAVASKREVRGDSDRRVPDAAVRRILEGDGSPVAPRNRRPWRFLVVGDPGVRERVAGGGLRAGQRAGRGAGRGGGGGGAGRRTGGDRGG